MTDADQQAFEAAFAAAVKTSLLKDGYAVVPGLGTFSVEHREAVLSSESGDNFGVDDATSSVRVRIEPPAKVVRFEPAKEEPSASNESRL